MLPSASSAAGAQPEVTATWVTDVTATSADLHAEVNPHGTASAYSFEYLTAAAYREAGESFVGAARAPSFGEVDLGSGSEAQPALQELQQLSPATGYRFRIVATNSSGETVAGAVHSFTTQPLPALQSDNCPNSELRHESNSDALPECRAWELVSPVDKNGGEISGFGAIAGGGVLQAAAGGGAVTYGSPTSFGSAPAGAPVASQYVAHRFEGIGWTSENITASTVTAAYPLGNHGVPYQLFSPDLERGLLLGGRRCGEGEACPRGYELREIAARTNLSSPAEPDLRFAGASRELHHVVLSTCAKLTPDATEVPNGGGGCDPAEPNLYDWSGGSLRLLNLLPAEAEGTPGAVLGAQGRAVSDDGGRIYFSAPEGGPIYLSEPGEPAMLVDGSAGGDARFQTASADGAVALFTRAGVLYRFDALTESSLPLASGVEGVLGSSADGSRVYYASGAGIFLWHLGTTSEVAAGAGAAGPGNYPPTTGTARVSPDGTHLAFVSRAPLTGYDNTDQVTGEPDAEVFLYAAPPAQATRLLCLSCNPTGARPAGPSTIRGAIANGEDPTATRVYKPRNLSGDGSRVFFDSSDAIVPSDTSAAQDVYEWRAAGTAGCQTTGGCLALISSGTGSEDSTFVDASADGSDAFFLTVDSLVDPDPGSVDLYDARIGGGFSLPGTSTCHGDECQKVPPPPDDPVPGTLVPGVGNPPVHFPRRCRKGLRRVVRHGKPRCLRKHRHGRHRRRHG